MFESNEIEIDVRYRHVTKVKFSGSLYHAFDRETGQQVTIKKFDFENQDKVGWAVRQVTVTRMLHTHENVTKIIDVMTIPLSPRTIADIEGIYVVAERKQGDLRGVLAAAGGVPLSTQLHKYILYQILRGFEFAHSFGVTHMCLEPAKINLNSRCDASIDGFGIMPIIENEVEAVRNSKGRIRSCLPYLAPEALIFPPNGGSFSDIWSVGCIFAEMLVGSTVWPATASILSANCREDQYINKHLNVIADMFGLKIRPEDFIGVIRSEGEIFNDGFGGVICHERHPYEAKLGDMNIIDSNSPNSEEQTKFRKTLFNCDPYAVDLLSRMLRIDPSDRITTTEALEHEYLSEVHQAAVRFGNQRERIIMNDFNHGQLFEKQMGTMIGLQVCLLKELERFRGGAYTRLREMAESDWEKYEHEMEKQQEERKKQKNARKLEFGSDSSASNSDSEGVKDYEEKAAKAVLKMSISSSQATAKPTLPKFKRARVINQPAECPKIVQPSKVVPSKVVPKHEYLHEVAHRMCGVTVQEHHNDVHEHKQEELAAVTLPKRIASTSTVALSPSVASQSQLPNVFILADGVSHHGNVLMLEGPSLNKKLWQSVFIRRPRFVAPRRIAALVRNPGQSLTRTTDFPPLLIDQEGLNELKKQAYDFNNCIYEPQNQPIPTEQQSAESNNANSKGLSLDKHLVKISQEIMENTSATPQNSTIDFITHRGNLTRIMLSMYGSEQDRLNAKWSVKVSKQGNTIHLEKHSVESGFADVAAEERYMQRLHWGKQYQALCTRRANINEKVEYTMMVQTKLNEHMILMAAEVDASTADGNFIDIKLANALLTSTDRGFFFRGKLMKMWVPSYLAGVPRLLVGFRDSIGRYESEEVFDTLKVPEQSRKILAMSNCTESCLSWEDMHLCLNFLDIVLSFLKTHVETEKTYSLIYEKGELCLKLNESQ